MRPAAAGVVAVALAALLAASGCRECPETVVSVDRLVGEHNANARAVPRLWARATMSVTLVDDAGLRFTWPSPSTRMELCARVSHVHAAWCGLP